MSTPLKHRWQLQEAKARLSELVRNAAAEGPQEITVHGKPAVVVLSKEEFDKLKSASQGKKPSFLEFMRASPLHGLDLDLHRSRDATQRKIDLFEDEE